MMLTSLLPTFVKYTGQCSSDGIPIRLVLDLKETLLYSSKAAPHPFFFWLKDQRDPFTEFVLSLVEEPVEWRSRRGREDINERESTKVDFVNIARDLSHRAILVLSGLIRIIYF